MKPAILILAGGEGQRIGGCKPQRKLKGRTLLERATERARSWGDEVAVAVRFPGQLGDIDLPFLVDGPEWEGPIAGLASGLRLKSETVLTIPCDMPFLPDDLPDLLAAALTGHCAAMAATDGQVHPVCTLWRKAALAQLPAYAASGRRSLIGFAETVGYVAVEGPQDAFFNVNSPEDLDEAEARLDRLER